MNQELVREVERLGGDPANPTWQWFLMMGPQGSDFTWGQGRREPAGYVGLELLRRVISELEAANPRFSTEARSVARCAIHSAVPLFVRRGLQVLGVVGIEADLLEIESLRGHADAAVASDARACAFELQRSVRRAPPPEETAEQ
jgi:hypothetical protein